MEKLSLVTGATGFLGSAVARALLTRGHRVRVLARPNGDRRNLLGLPVEICEGRLEDSSSLKTAIAGCNYLFHVAADYRLWVRDKSAMLGANVEGTRALMQAALENNVERIVYTSSVAVLGHVSHGVADENTPSGLDDMVGIYKQSKFLAEQQVSRMIAEDNLPAIIVNPSTPIGPRDIKPTPTGRIIVEAALGRIPAYLDTGLNVVHVDDVALGHLQALDFGIIGERYILGGTNLSLVDILRHIGKRTGRPDRLIRLPRLPLFPVAVIAEGVARFTGKEPMITVDALKMAKWHMWFSSAKAEAALGYRHRPADQALDDALTWFQAEGLLLMTPILMILMIIVSLAWLWLLFNRGMFWLVDPLKDYPAPEHWPEVVAIIPARNEAAGIAETVRSLLSQDYPGKLSVIVTDDHSDDGTAGIAYAAALDLEATDRVTIISAPPLPPDWAGKMWAQQQGLSEAVLRYPAATLYLLTDADIHHAPEELRRMVARLEAKSLDLASLMVRLSIATFAEKAVIPAFIFFFRLLYPFRWVGDSAKSTAGAAGGYMLIRRMMLERIGGLTAIRGALIDDCALAIAVKRAGGRLSLDLAGETYSLRRYHRVGEIWMMIARSAYTQLNHSPFLLAGTVLAMGLGFLLPPLVTFQGGDAAWIAAFAWIAMSIAYLPVLSYHHLPSWVAPALPIVALFYLGATVDSARRHWLGRGGQWKGRVQRSAPLAVTPEKE